MLRILNKALDHGRNESQMLVFSKWRLFLQSCALHTSLPLSHSPSFLGMSISLGVIYPCVVINHSQNASINQASVCQLVTIRNRCHQEQMAAEATVSFSLKPRGDVQNVPAGPCVISSSAPVTSSVFNKAKLYSAVVWESAQRTSPTARRK